MNQGWQMVKWKCHPVSPPLLTHCSFHPSCHPSPFYRQLLFAASLACIETTPTLESKHWAWARTMVVLRNLPYWITTTPIGLDDSMKIFETKQRSSAKPCSLATKAFLRKASLSPSFCSVASFELPSSHARVTSIKFTKRESVSQLVTSIVNDRTRVW